MKTVEKSLSVERIRELAKIWNRETKKFLILGIRYGSPHPLFLHYRDINTVDLGAMSRKWDGATEDELRGFIRLQRRLSNEAHGLGEAIPPEDIADELGVPASERDAFVDYFYEQVVQIRTETEELDEPVDLRHGDDSDEFDEEQDMLDDAGRRGLAHDA